MDKSIVKVGNVSTENSQAGSVYGSWGGISNYMCRDSWICNGIYRSKKMQGW